MNQLQKKMTQKKTTPKSFIEQIEECLTGEYMVEIMFKSDFEITGKISVIGNDFLGLISIRERTVETTSKGQDGKTEKQQIRQIFELETFVKFEEIQAISRVLKSSTK